jgi:hypothetical protein
MTDPNAVMPILGAAAVFSVWPISKLIEWYVKRTDEQDWLAVQEEARHKPTLVGSLRDLLKE